MLQGERIYLRLMEEWDVPFKVKWVNDSEVRYALNFDYPISEVGTRQWLNKVALDNSRRDFIVCLRETDQQIGYCGFLDVDLRALKAEIYIGIGEKDYLGQGLAQEIRTVQLDYGFGELGLNKIYSYIWTENKAMIHINKKFGFAVEGILRQDVFSHGEYRDRVIMGLLKKDYLKLDESPIGRSV